MNSMRSSANALILGLMVLLTPVIAHAQGASEAVCGFTGTGSTTATQVGGQWISARDTVHVLVVFVQFPDDNYDTTYSLWPTYPSLGIYPGPTFMSEYIDSVPSQLTTNGNLTHYCRDMSLGRFTLTGKTRFVVTPQTHQWYLNNNWNRWLINKQVLGILDSALEFSQFDRWKRYGEYDNRREPDSWVDMVFVIYRRVESAAALSFYGAEASLGYARNYPPYNEPTWFYVDGGQRRIGHGHPVFGDPGSGTTSVIGGAGDSWFGLLPYRVQIHEFAHHWMTHGANYGHNGGGFWGMLNDWAARSNSQFIYQPNSFERELLGWIAPDSIYQTSTGITLTDYTTTGRAVKIKVPGSNPTEVFRLEYHLKVSQFDNPEMHNPDAKGLYIIHQTGIDNPQDQLSMLASDGRWMWVSEEVVYPPYYPPGLAVYRKTGIDRVDGQHDSRPVSFTWVGPPPTPNVPNPSWIHFHRDRQTNQVVEQTIFRGDGRDAWSLAKNNVFTPWSNPNSQNQAKQKTWVGIQIVNEISKVGTIVLNVYIDSAACVALSPSKPQDPQLSSNSGQYGNIRFSWAANQEPDLAGYEVSRKVDLYGGVWEVVAQLVTSTYWVDPEFLYAPEGGDFRPTYRVRARDTPRLVLDKQ